MALVAKVDTDQLRRAFTAAVTADAGSETGPTLEEMLVPRFPADAIDALMARVLLIFLFSETDEAEELIQSVSPLGVPEFHPALYDVAATHPVPTFGIAAPEPFFRALQKRLKVYATMTGGMAR